MSLAMPRKDNESIRRRCLNDWWDFQPVFGDPADGRVDLACGVPQDGWIADAMLVPSTWNKPLDAVRTSGETMWRCAADTHSPPGAIGDKVPAGTEYLDLARKAFRARSSVFSDMMACAKI